MSHDAGLWIDHKKAVIVSIAAGHVRTRALGAPMSGPIRMGRVVRFPQLFRVLGLNGRRQGLRNSIPGGW